MPSNSLVPYIPLLEARAACEPGMAWAYAQGAGFTVEALVDNDRVRIGNDANADSWSDWVATHVPGLPQRVLDEFQALGCGSSTFDENGELHSFNDEPALIDHRGDRHWYKHGKRHRGNDRPATIEADGHRVWYVDGEQTKRDLRVQR